MINPRNNFMTRLGKIARMPQSIRDALNERLQNGEEGKDLVEWLNGQAEAQEVLRAKFDGRAVSEQNLSEWKQGGYEDWLRLQEDCALARSMMERADELESESDGRPLEEMLVAPLALALARLLRAAEEQTDLGEKCRVVLGIARQLTQLRRGTQERERVRLEEERLMQAQWDREVKQRQVLERQSMWEMLQSEMGVGKSRRGEAEEAGPMETEANKANPSQSNRIKADQTCEIGGKEAGRAPAVRIDGGARGTG